MSENCRKSTLQFPRAQAHVFKKLVLSDKQSKPQDIQIAAIEDLRKTIKSKSIQNQWIFGTFALKITSYDTSVLKMISFPVSRVLILSLCCFVYSWVIWLDNVPTVAL